MPIKLLTSESKLRPGCFYRAGNRSVWCCFRVDLDKRAHLQASCVNVFNRCVECFFLDGRYEVTGQDSSRLVEELVEEQELGLLPYETDILVLCSRLVRSLVARQTDDGPDIEATAISAARELRDALTRKLGDG